MRHVIGGHRANQIGQDLRLDIFQNRIETATVCREQFISVDRFTQFIRAHSGVSVRVIHGRSDGIDRRFHHFYITLFIRIT